MPTSLDAAALESGDSAVRKHIRSINRETNAFRDSCKDMQKLDFFAERWNLDGHVKPLLRLIKIQT